MSKHTVFVCVEGHRADRYIYGELCARICRPKGVAHQVITPEELPSAQLRGKQGLLSFFEHLRSTGSLETVLNGKLTIGLFFLDKDVDDYLGDTISDSKLIYTKHYDIESHIFRAGDLVTYVSALSGLDRSEVAQHFSPRWRAQVAHLWKEWVKICLFCKKHAIRGHPGYRVVSQINLLGFGHVDAALYSQYLTGMQVASGLSPEAFQRKFTAVSRLVEHLYRKDRYDSVFKGKWYRLFVVQSAVFVAQGRQFDRHALDAGIVGALSAGADLDDDEFAHFHEAVAKGLSTLLALP